MNSTFLAEILPALSPDECTALEKWLVSPFFNQRADVPRLFACLQRARAAGTFGRLEKSAVWEWLYPGERFDADRLNHVFSFLLKQIEHFLAYREWTTGDETSEPRVELCRALRKRGLSAAFERHAERLRQKLDASPHRHAGHYQLRYRLAGEVFRHHAAQRRGGREEAREAVAALDGYYAIENLGWACTLQSLQSLSSESVPFSPLTGRVLDLVVPAASVAEPTKALPEVDGTGGPAAVLLYECFQVLSAPDPAPHFERLKALLLERPDIFPGTESRDQYMAAINYCIRRHNGGERAYTREAFDLYRAALERGVLVEHGRMPAYTYTNINLLAHVAGEPGWALDFLGRYRAALPAADRDNTWRYNLAFHHFRAGRYDAVLELLQQVEFGEVFMSLDARKMLLRSYFELGEFDALDSLLASFRTFLRRRPELGYHRESYLNLLKFTKKLMRALHGKAARRRTLAAAIRAEKALAEREWLLDKTQGK